MRLPALCDSGLTRLAGRFRLVRAVWLAAAVVVVTCCSVALTLPPLAAAVTAPAPVTTKVFTYGLTARSERLTAYYDAKRSGAPWLVYVHGGYWTTGSHKTNAAWAKGMAAHGYQVFVVDYPKETTAVWPAQRTSVTNAIAWIRAHPKTFKIDPQRMALLGGSAGGQIAMNTAANLPQGKKAIATVSFAGVNSPWAAYLAAHDHAWTGDGDKSTELADAATILIGCSRASGAACARRWDDADATRAFGPDDGALAAWHCTDDLTVPASHSEEAIATAQAHQVSDATLYERQCDNHLIATDPEMTAEAATWLDTRLGLGQTSAAWRAAHHEQD